MHREWCVTGDNLWRLVATRGGLWWRPGTYNARVVEVLEASVDDLGRRIEATNDNVARKARETLHRRRPDQTTVLVRGERLRDRCAALGLEAREHLREHWGVSGEGGGEWRGVVVSGEGGGGSQWGGGVEVGLGAV